MTVNAMTKNQTERVVLMRYGASLRLPNLDQERRKFFSLSRSNSDGGHKRLAPIFAPLFSKLIQTNRARPKLHPSPKTGSRSRRSANARRGKFSNNQRLPPQSNRGRHGADKRASNMLR